MDRSWMTKSRITTEYQNGLEYFLDYAFRNASMYDKILCPCKRCGMGICVSRDDAFEHLTVDGFIPGYTHWIAHGELPSILSARGENQRNTLGDDNVQGSVHDSVGVPNEDGCTEEYVGQIKGEDKPGHVRMMGQEVCPSDISNETPKSTSNRLIKEYKKKIARLEAMLETKLRICASQVHKGTNVGVSESLSLNATSTQVDKVEPYVSLRSIHTNKIVAKGYIISIDPNTKVGGQAIGQNWCEIFVKVVVEPQEQLIRPYDNFQELSQAVGHMVAWPRSLVTPTEHSLRIS